MAKRWSEEETQLLIARYPDGVSAAAKALPGRSPEQISAKAFSMGVKVKKTDRLFTAAMDKQAQKLRAAGKSYQEIAEALGLSSRRQVDARFQYLRKREDKK